jgi:hypothetical protein
VDLIFSRDQEGTTGRHSQSEFFVCGLLAGVDPFEVADEFRGDAPAGLARAIAWTDLGEKDFRLSGRQVFLRPAGDELEEQVV